MNTRLTLNSLALVLALGLAACAGSNAPPPRYYQLRLDAPVPMTATVPASVGI